ncbi:hypothetical protein Tco_1457421 [Tanacetum coccineum]
MENILESFKLIVKWKVFWARAKELFVWSPSFKDVPEKEFTYFGVTVKSGFRAANKGESNDKDGTFPLICGYRVYDSPPSHTTCQFYSGIFSDFGPTPFRVYHSCLSFLDFDDLVSKILEFFTLDDSRW